MTNKLEHNEASSWKFDKNIAPIFDEHVRQHVPLYEEMHRMITDMSHWFVADKTNVYDIGTSTGQLIFNLYNEHCYDKKELKYIGIDNSIDMINRADKGLGHVKNLDLRYMNVENVEFTNASLIVSMLTMQFIPQLQRQNVLNKIYNGLNHGGGFILVEKVIGNNARFNEMWVELYHELKLRNGLTEKQVMDKARAIRGVLKPFTIDENINMLREARFKEIDVFFKWGNFAGIVATK